MRKSLMLAIAVAVLAVPALAQDSVSKNFGGLPGDGLDPWTPGQLCTDYVVDMTTVKASWGTRFAIAPLIKASKPSVYYYSNLLSAQTMSRIRAQNVAFPFASYKQWVKQPGYGVHPTQNLAPATVAPTGTSNQFGVAFTEFSYTNDPNGPLPKDPNSSYNGVIGAVVNYSPSNPLHLYVHRVQAATNSTNPHENRSQFGIGGVDERGNIMIRADGFQAPGPNVMVGTNYFNLDVLSRNCNVVNYLDNSGMSDTSAGFSTWILQHATDFQYDTPNIGPESIFGLPYCLGANFNKQYAYGPASPLGLTTAHRPNTDDHRAGVCYMTRNISCVAGDHGTGAMLTYLPGGSTDKGISVFGLNNVANVSGAVTFGLPAAAITDPAYPAVSTLFPASFDHYHSTVATRGGNSPIAMNVDPDGRLLLAGVLYWDGCGNQCPYNAIVAARVDPQTCTPTWTLVAYTADQSLVIGTGKPILNGPNGTMIGRMCQVGEPALATNGIGVSAPMIDAGGNIWFLSSVSMYHTDPNNPYTDYTTALLRAVYNPTNFSYQLERVFEIGYNFTGLNSGRLWKIIFATIRSSVAVNSGTAWSSNMTQDGANGIVPGPGWDPKDARSLGGMVVNVDIAYDADGDGTLDPNNPASEEIYTTMLYLTAAPPICHGDLNCDGTINFKDINPFVTYLSNYSAWLLSYLTCSPQNGDINGDGTYPSFKDINPFVSLLSTNPVPPCPTQ